MKMMRALAIVALASVSLGVDAYQASSGLLTPDTPKTSAAMSGVVTDATTGRPLEGAVVSLGVTTGGPVLVTLPRAVTDAKGRFLFRDLAPSTKYELHASHVGYVLGRYGASGPVVPSDRLGDQTRTVDDVVTISVAADQWVSDLQISLWRLGSISGHVIDERGEPIVGVAVRGFSTSWVAGHPQFVGTDVATTDDRGVYRLANLLPGKYAVSVLSVQSTVLTTTPDGDPQRAVAELVHASDGPNPGMPAVDVDGTHRLAITNFAVPPPPDAKTPRVYAAQFYPNALTMANAQFLDVSSGTFRRDVDFQLQPVAAVTVSGHVEAAGDASSTLLRLMPVGSEMLGFGSEAATTVVERNGSFTFLHVPSGEYTVMAQAAFGEFSNGNGEVSIGDPPGFPGGLGQVPMAGLPGLAYASHSAKTKTWGRATVAVGTTDVTGVLVPLRPATTVRGRVVIAGGGKRPGAMILAEPANGDPSAGRLGVYLEEVNGEAPFAIEGFAGGRYLFTTSSPSVMSVMSVTTGGREIRDTGLDTSAGGDIDDVVVTLTTNVTSLQGTVSGDGKAVATVVMFPADRARWIDYGPEPLAIRSKAADRDGVYTIKGLPEGEYFAVAVDRSLHDAWTHPAFLEAASAVAKRVTLQAGEKQTLDLPLSQVVVK